MQQGDVFQVGDEDQHYLTEAVAPNGTIYARKFDLDSGPYGEPVAFKEDDELNIIFNTFESPPEEEEGWEYCEITHVTKWSDQWTGSEWFAAEVTGPQGKQTVATSKGASFIRGETTLNIDRDKSREIYDRFLFDLFSEGWDIVAHGRAWYQARLRREIEEQASAESEGPGCLASLFGRRS